MRRRLVCPERTFCAPGVSDRRCAGDRPFGGLFQPDCRVPRFSSQILSFRNMGFPNASFLCHRQQWIGKGSFRGSRTASLDQRSGPFPQNQCSSGTKGVFLSSVMTDQTFRRCFDQSFEGVILLDRRTFLIRMANRTFLRMLGYPDGGNPEGYPLDGCFQERTVKEIREEVRALEERDRPDSTLQARILRQDGSFLDAKLSLALLADGDDPQVLIHACEQDRGRESGEILRLSIELDRRLQKGYSLETLLGLTVRRIAEDFPFLFVYFVVPEADGGMRFPGVSAKVSGVEQELRSTLSVLKWNDFPGSLLPCSKVIQSLKPRYMTIGEMGENRLSSLFKKLDLRAMYSIPILKFREGLPRGILSVGIRHQSDLAERVKDQLLDFSEKIRLAFDYDETNHRNKLAKEAFFDQAPDGIYIVDPESLVFLEVNRTFCEMLGHSGKSDLIGKSLLEVTDADESTVRKAVGTFEGRYDHSLIFKRRFRRKDGSRFHVSVSCSLLPYNGGNALLSHARDVSRDVEMEAVNRISQELDRRILKGESLDVLLAFIVEGIFEAFGFAVTYFSVPEPDGTIRYVKICSTLPDFSDILLKESHFLKWNAPPGNRRMSSQALESRKPLYSEVREYEDSPLWETFRKAGISASFMIPILREPETLLPWGILTASVVDGRDLPERVRAILLDLSEKIRMAFVRFDEQTRIRLQQTAMESARSPFLIARPDGTVEWANSEFRRMVQHDPAQQADISIADFFPGPIGQSDPSTLMDVIRGGSYYQGEIPGKSMKGNHFMTETIVSPIQDPLGKVSHMLVHQKDVTLEKEQEREIWRLAHIDALTGMLNWKAFLDLLGNEVSLAREEERPLGILFLDLDGFKEVNDTLGHEIGNRFLQLIGKGLSGCLDATEVIARIGGDEFVILCKKNPCNREALLPLLNRLMDAVSRPVALDGRSFQTTASIGICFFPMDGSQSADLVRKADIAMYQSKKQGKRAWSFFDQSMEEEIRYRYDEVSSLEEGLKKKEFFLVYQPQMDLVEQKVLGVEALVRRNCSDGSIMMPKSFIALAEETGFIVPLGECILDQAFETIKRWIAVGMKRLRVSVNLSSRQFWSPDFWSRLKSRIDAQPEIGKWLSLELTESLLMHNPDEVGDLLASLRKAGVRISIDDFGTGYSSLSYLSRLKVDEIKVPQEFVLRMKDREEDRTIVRTIVQMAKSLKIDLVGEGAESETEIGMLLDMGCNVLQGYMISKPLSLEEAEGFIGRYQMSVANPVEGARENPH
ncbi:MAG: EAL domain-containing protein [Leptospirales bacterium]